MRYCTPTDVSNHLGIGTLDDDSLIAGYIDAATAWIDQYCHRTFQAATDTTRYVDAQGDHIRGRVLYIDSVGELAQITSIVLGDGETLDVDNYVTQPRNEPPFWALRIKSKSQKRWVYVDDWEDAIAITGRWAYSVSPPAAVAQACIQLAAFYYRQKDQPFTDVTAVEAGVVMRPTGIPTAVTNLLKPYRKP